MTNEGIRGIIIYFQSFIQEAIALIIGLTLVVFIWGIFKLIFAKENSKEREQARGYIVWGIIALAVMVSVWGLVNLLTSSLALHNTTVMPGFPDTNI